MGSPEDAQLSSEPNRSRDLVRNELITAVGGPEFLVAVEVLAGCLGWTVGRQPWAARLSPQLATASASPTRLDDAVEALAGISGVLLVEPTLSAATVFARDSRVIWPRPSPACLVHAAGEVGEHDTLVLVPWVMISGVVLAAARRQAPHVRWRFARDLASARAHLEEARADGIRSVVGDADTVLLAQELGLKASVIYVASGSCLLADVILQLAARRLSGTLAHLAGGATRLHDAPPFQADAPPEATKPPGHALDRTPRHVIGLRTGRRRVVLPTRLIVYCQGEGGLVEVFTEAGQFYTDLRLDQLERRLHPRRFVRVDRSRLIQIERIVEFSPLSRHRWRLLLAGSGSQRTELVIGPRAVARLRRLLGL